MTAAADGPGWLASRTALPTSNWASTMGSKAVLRHRAGGRLKALLRSRPVSLKVTRISSIVSIRLRGSFGSDWEIPARLAIGYRCLAVAVAGAVAVAIAGAGAGAGAVAVAVAVAGAVAV